MMINEVSRTALYSRCERSSSFDLDHFVFLSEYRAKQSHRALACKVDADVANAMEA